MQFFDFASLQRTFKTQATQFGFVDTVNPWCVSCLHSDAGDVCVINCTMTLASEAGTDQQ